MYQILIIFIFLFGLIIGSFLNCLIWRLHKKEKMWGRSYCPKCRKQINWYDNIPVISFLILRGKCRECRKKISVQYPLVELATGILFIVSFYYNFQFSPAATSAAGQAIFNFQTIINYQFSIFDFIGLFRDWFIISVMIVIFVIDFRWYLILDKVTIPSVIIVFILNLFLGFSWLNLLISGIIGGSFFLLQFVISRGKWIGGGDIRLGLLMGFALGWPHVVLAIFMAYFIGSIIGIGLISSGKKEWGSRVPMGTFLSVATVITLIWGGGILNWYLNLF